MFQTDIKSKDFLEDLKWMLQAICVAITFHLLLAPIIWISGSLLPWPHAPNRLTTFEINLKSYKVDVKSINTTILDK